MKNIPLKALTLTCVLAGFASVQSHADIIVSEKFDYTLGENIGGNSGGLGWNGGWQGGTSARGTATIADVNFGLKVPQGYSQTVGSPALRLRSNGSGFPAAQTGTVDTYRNLGTGISLKPEEQSTHYFSFLWARVDEGDNHFAKSSYFSLRNSAGGQLLNFGVFRDGRLQIEAGAPATGEGSLSAYGKNIQQSITNDINTTGHYLFVGKMVLNENGESQFYLSAYNSGDVLVGEPETWDVSLSTNLVDLTISRVYLVSQQGAGQTYWDNITFGTSFEDVGGAIPESSTVALVMGVGVLGLVAARRLRRGA